MDRRLQLTLSSSFNFKMNYSSSLHLVSAIPLLTFLTCFGLRFEGLLFLERVASPPERVCNFSSIMPLETDRALTFIEGLVTIQTRENEFFRLLRKTLALGSLIILYRKLSSG